MMHDGMRIFLSCASALALAAAGLAQTATYEEPYRPQFHFSPAINWTNDPNGLVYHAGEWHLFYQYNPFGDLWGHMSWGHAVSPDLFHWKHLPVALPEVGEVMIFSGSAVVDHANSSGLGSAAEPPMVAIYTSRTTSDQTQSIAYSTDKGRTWTDYEGNPVIDIDDPAFRDPRVFWHAATERWIMAVVLANQRKVRLFGSPDLKTWKFLSDFGPEGAHPVSNWECPDLFELPVEGEPGQSKWILQVDSGMGHPWLGSGCQYFVGEFDGERFINDNPPETALWLDWGRDFYAAQSYSDVPEQDGRRLVIGWISNWMYARDKPTSPWRGAQSVARELRLKRFDKGLRLVQQPAREIESLRGTSMSLRDLSVAEANHQIEQAGFSGDTLELQLVVAVDGARDVGVQLLQGTGEETLVGFTAAPAEVYVDRRKSGKVDFHESFAGRHSARLAPVEGRVRLRILVDRSVVEVFAGEGEVAITDRVFPSPSSTGLSLFEKGGNARVVSLDAWQLKSVWK